MKNAYKLFVAFFLLVFALSMNKANAQQNPAHPTFEMTVKNIYTTQPGSTVRDSIVRFDVYIQQWITFNPYGINFVWN